MTDKQLEAITSRLDGLKTLIEKSITASEEAKTAAEKLHGLWDKDREDFSSFKIALADLKNSFDEARKLLFNLPGEVASTVKEALKPAEKQVKQLQNAIVETEVVALSENKIKLPIGVKIKSWINKFKKSKIENRFKK